MEKKKTLIAMTLALFVGACGGGGGSSSKSGSSLGKELNAGSPDGIYLGDGFDIELGDQTFVSLILNNKMYALSSANTQYEGEVVPIIGEDYNLSLLMYDGDDLGVYDQAIVEGTFSEGDYIDGAYDRQFGGEGNFELSYVTELTEKPAAVEMVSGTWSDSNLGKPPTITIDGSGDLFGSDVSGCIYTGTVMVPRNDRNLYQVALRIESCGQYNGSYEGAASVLTYPEDESLWMFVANNFYAFPFVFVKQ